MKDSRKTKAQLIKELEKLRLRLAEHDVPPQGGGPAAGGGGEVESDLPDSPRVLVVDDEERVLCSVADALRKDFEVSSTQSPKEALRMLEQEAFHILLVDLMMDEMRGMELIRRASDIRPDIVPIVLTGHASKDLAIDALKQGVYDFLEKPMRADALAKAVRRAWKALRTELQNRKLVQELRKANKELETEVIERKRAENALRDSQERYRMLIENIPMPVTLHDRDGRLLFINEVGAHNLGGNPGKLVGKSMREFFPRDTADEAIRRIRQAFDSGEIVRHDIAIDLPAGRQHFDAVLQPIKDAEGMVTSVQIAAHDITERKHAEEALKKSEHLHRTAIEAAGAVPYFRNYQANRYEFMGTGIEDLTGYSKEEFTPGVWDEMIQEAVPTGEFAGMTAADAREKARCQGSPVWSADYRIRTKAGDERWLACAAADVRDEQGNSVHSVGLFLDITERKQAEEALRESAQKYRAMFEGSRDAITVTSREGEFLDVNQAALDLFGYTKDEIMGMDVRSLYVDPRDREQFQKEIEKDGHVRDYELKMRGQDGVDMDCLVTSAVWQAENGSIMGYQSLIRDMTEKRRIEEELRRAEKLESVGILAGGIAHDYNNLLVGILGNASLAKSKLDPNNPIFERVAVIEKAAYRAKDLTQQLLTFARGGAPVRKPISLASIIKDSVAFALRGSNVQCRFSFPDDLWLAEVDEGQMNQVISNLVINADHAMPEGGTIGVHAENLTLSEGSALPVGRGRYVKVSLEDRGIGMAKEHLPRIFDPYFTTKPRGSGLGLATVYSIIKNHGGHITVESELGLGTTFHIYLPASEETASETAAREKEILTGRGKILVMDDEEIVREAAGEMLAHIGYETEFARDGNEAIQLLAQAMESGQPFDVIIIDLTIPGGMGGSEAIGKLREIHPGIKAIVSSGYSDVPTMTEFKQHGFDAIITKPYELHELSRTLHSLLSGRDTSS